MTLPTSRKNSEILIPRSILLSNPSTTIHHHRRHKIKGEKRRTERPKSIKNFMLSSTSIVSVEHSTASVLANLASDHALEISRTHKTKSRRASISFAEKDSAEIEIFLFLCSKLLLSGGHHCSSSCPKLFGSEAVDLQWRMKFHEPSDVCMSQLMDSVKTCCSSFHRGRRDEASSIDIRIQIVDHSVGALSIVLMQRSQERE